MVRHSKLQIQVLNLYREFLRIGKQQPGIVDFVKSEFRKNAAIPKMNTIQIEQSYRRGVRQLEMLKRKDVQGASVFTGQGRK